MDDEGDEFAIEVDGGANVKDGQLIGSFRGYNLQELYNLNAFGHYWST